MTKQHKRTGNVKGQRLGAPEMRTELAREVEAALEGFSLRELSDRLKVSHNALWRLVNQDSRIRASTLRAIREGMDQLNDERPSEALLGSFVRSLPGLAQAQLKVTEQAIAKTILRAYDELDLDEPRWLRRVAGERVDKKK